MQKYNFEVGFFVPRDDVHMLSVNKWILKSVGNVD